MIKRQVGRHRASLGLEHDGLIGRGDLPEERKLLVGERAAGWLVPELEEAAVDFADATGELEPAVIRVATGTRNKARAQAMEHTLRALKDAGRRDIFALLADGRLRIQDVHDDYHRNPAALLQRVAQAQSEAVGPLVDTWLAWLEDPATLSPKTRRRYSARTIVGYRWCWDQVLKLLPRGRASAVTDLTTGFVADYRARRLRAGASGPTVNRNLTALSAFLTWCETERGLSIERPKMPHEREHDGRERWLSAEELAQLQRAVPTEGGPSLRRWRSPVSE